MPYPIIEYLTKGEVESSDDAVLLVDLPRNEQIYNLMLELRITNTSSVNNVRSILDAITKIEVVADGVKTLFSAESEIASYFAFVAQGGVLCDHRFFGGNVVNRLHLPIYFGRYPGDLEYMLDTGNYRNVQLRITYALNTTYEATGTFTHTISMQRPLNRQTGVIGFLRSREVQVETPSASAQDISHTLPTSYPWHYVGVRVDDIDQDFNTDLTALKLTIDEGRLNLLDVDADEVNYYDRLRYAHTNSYVNQPAVTGQATVLTFGDWAFPRGAVPVVLGDRLATVTSVAGEQCVLAVYSDTSQAGDAIAVALDMPSPNPHSCFTLFDGRMKPFDAPAFSQGKITYTMASYTLTLRTFIQELVRGSL